MRRPVYSAERWGRFFGRLSLKPLVASCSLRDLECSQMIAFATHFVEKCRPRLERRKFARKSRLYQQQASPTHAAGSFMIVQRQRIGCTVQYDSTVRPVELCNCADGIHECCSRRLYTACAHAIALVKTVRYMRIHRVCTLQMMQLPLFYTVNSASSTRAVAIVPPLQVVLV